MAKFMHRCFRGVHNEISWKRIGFVMATIVAYVFPTLICVFGGAPWTLWFDFYTVIIPSTLVIYVGGKYVDGGLPPKTYVNGPTDIDDSDYTSTISKESYK